MKPLPEIEPFFCLLQQENIKLSQNSTIHDFLQTCSASVLCVLAYLVLWTYICLGRNVLYLLLVEFFPVTWV